MRNIYELQLERDRLEIDLRYVRAEIARLRIELRRKEEEEAKTAAGVAELSQQIIEPDGANDPPDIGVVSDAGPPPAPHPANTETEGEAPVKSYYYPLDKPF